MSQEGDGDGGLAGFAWEAQPWSFSNSDPNNCSGGSEPNNKSGKKPAVPLDHSPAGEKKGKRSVTRADVMPSKGTAAGGGGGGESDHEIHIWTERERRKKMRNMFSTLHSLLPHLPPKADKSTIVDEAVNYIKNLEQTFQKLQKQKLERIQAAGASSSSFDLGRSSTTAPPVQSQGTAPLTMECSREAFVADQVMKQQNPTMNTPMAAPTPGRLSNCFQTWSSPNVVLNVSGDDAHISICTAKKPGILTTIFHIMEKHKLEVVTATVSSDYFRSMYMIHARVGTLVCYSPLLRIYVSSVIIQISL